MEYTAGKTVFGDWKIVKEIGAGSYGRVFEIRKTNYGITTHSALKVIRIPHSPSDIRAALNEGMDEQSVTTYFQGFVNEIVQEIAVMSSLKSHSNIVGYEDHVVLDHAGDIGWDILIRMELLTPLQDHLCCRQLHEIDVLQIAEDICSALSFCQKKGMIHRDVKPENIFVSETGRYKLGDFGVARTIEKTTGGLSKKGTESYMAPEVYLGQPYGSSVDIYSLGLVLYKLMNNNRLPLFPPISRPITFADRENALSRRMKGEKFSPPINASREFAEVILKACAYRPEARYKTAAEMLEAVTEIKSKYSFRSYVDAMPTEKEQTNKPVMFSDATSVLFGADLCRKGTVANEKNDSIQENGDGLETSVQEVDAEENRTEESDLYNGTIGLWDVGKDEMKESHEGENQEIVQDEKVDEYNEENDTGTKQKTLNENIENEKSDVDSGDTSDSDNIILVENIQTSGTSDDFYGQWKKNKEKKKKKWVGAIGMTAALLLIAVIGFQLMKYQKDTMLQKAGTIQDYEAFIEKYPEEAEGYLGLSELYMDSEDYEMACGILEVGMRACKDTSEMEEKLSKAECLRDYQEKISEARSLLETQNYDQAIEKYKEALEIDHSDSEAYTKIVKCYLLQNKVDEALAYVESIDTESLYTKLRATCIYKKMYNMMQNGDYNGMLELYNQEGLHFMTYFYQNGELVDLKSVDYSMPVAMYGSNYYYFWFYYGIIDTTGNKNGNGKEIGINYEGSGNYTIEGTWDNDNANGTAKVYETSEDSSREIWNWSYSGTVENYLWNGAVAVSWQKTDGTKADYGVIYAENGTYPCIRQEGDKYVYVTGMNTGWYWSYIDSSALKNRGPKSFN